MKRGNKSEANIIKGASRKENRRKRENRTREGKKEE